MSDELVSYVRNSIVSGIEESVLRDELIRKGYTNTDIDEAFRAVMSESQEPIRENRESAETHFADQIRSLFSTKGFVVTTIFFIFVSIVVAGLYITSFVRTNNLSPLPVPPVVQMPVNDNPPPEVITPPTRPTKIESGIQKSPVKKETGSQAFSRISLSANKTKYAPRETVVFTAKIKLDEHDEVVSLMLSGEGGLLLNKENAKKTIEGIYTLYQWSIPLPPSASPGNRTFKVVALINQTVMESNAVTVSVVIDPTVAKLQMITISPKGSIMLFVGESPYDIFVNGYYTDGHNRNISSESSGTQYITAVPKGPLLTELEAGPTDIFDVRVKGLSVELTGRKKGTAGLIIENGGVRYERFVEVFSSIDDPDLDR
jgi:hypothetical protein